MSFIKYTNILIFIFIVNCSGNKVSNFHGSKALDLKFEKLIINETNKNDLVRIIGSPSTVSDFDKNKWFYNERNKTNQSIFKFGTQKINKNNILIVELNNAGILKNKKLLNINDMNDLNYLKKETNKEFKNKDFIYGVFSSLREKINAPLRNR